MPNSKNIRVTIDSSRIRALESKFAGSKERFDKALQKNVGLFSLEMENDSKALAPRQDGELENSIQSKTSFRNGVASSVTGSNLKYALRRHEEHERKGVYPLYRRGVKHPDYYYNGRGEITRAKSPVGGFQPGRKYLHNAAILNKDNWYQTISDSLKESWE
ncbi:HK97 gp10 family phage protein [Staphylococcus pseudintermedius]|nr:HK97 gp10 family phage protein [Staphylococcus pseudintermedius]